MAAASIQVAATSSAVYVQSRYQNGFSLKDKLTLWVNAIAAVFPNPNDKQRTITNWVPVGRAIATRLQPGDQISQIEANEVAVIVYRTCRAIEFAARVGVARISTAQRNTLLASFNTIWANDEN